MPIVCAGCGIPAMEMEKNHNCQKKGDPVNHPDHYTWMPNGTEVIDITELFNFNRGNALKYVMRAGRKGDAAKEIQDLEKARWYLDREIDRLKPEEVSTFDEGPIAGHVHGCGHPAGPLFFHKEEHCSEMGLLLYVQWAGDHGNNNEAGDDCQCFKCYWKESEA